MSHDSPILHTTHGSIKGQKCTTIYGEEYYSFEGIPYAQPPVGNLRFKAPQPITPWMEVLDCTKSAKKPLQKNLFTLQSEGAEDCLYLNVYTKQLESENPLPVLVYIFGGAFQNGDATKEQLGPDYFMQEQVVLVTLNYRLGPLGFLCLNDPTLQVPGNAGLKDQLAAFRWFKQNCAIFNGNTDNITLFGNSAGSASAHYLMITEQSRGLFHKAILQSGTVYNKWAHVPMGNYAYRLAKLLGYEGAHDEKQVLEFLTKVEAEKLMGEEVRTDEERWQDISFAFGPVVEPYASADCIIPKTPKEMLKTSWSNEIPIIVGGTSFEGLLSYPKIKADKRIIEIHNVRPELVVPWEVRAHKPVEECRKWGKELLKLHFGDTPLNMEGLFKYLDIISYKIFWHGFERTVHSRLIHATAPTYMYRFDYDSPDFNLHRLKYCGPNMRGVAHADELSYLYYGRSSYKLPTNSEEFLTIKRMVGMWTSFARNSDPNCEQIKPTVWQPLEDHEPHRCLNISNEVKMMELPEAKKLAVWNSMYTKDELY